MIKCTSINRLKIKHATIAMAMAACISGCTTTDSLSPLPEPGRSSNGSRILACKNTDTLVRSSSDCLQDDAACYQLQNGQWCTGERGNICPTGSIEVPADTPCPSGKRCFRVAESLQCTIS